MEKLHRKVTLHRKQKNAKGAGKALGIHGNNVQLEKPSVGNVKRKGISWQCRTAQRVEAIEESHEMAESIHGNNTKSETRRMETGHTDEWRTD